MIGAATLEAIELAPSQRRVDDAEQTGRRSVPCTRRRVRLPHNGQVLRGIGDAERTRLALASAELDRVRVFAAGELAGLLALAQVEARGGRS